MSRLAPMLPGQASLAVLAQRIESETGLHFAPGRQRELAAALGRMAAAAGFAQPDECARWLLAGQWDAARTALCARFLTIGETYFFREPRALELVCEYARERIAAGPGYAPLRLWSAGCCTGEEPYSIAMTLRERLPGLAPDKVSILATDLNEAFLAFARAGLYRRWSFRRTAPALQRAHFEPAPGGRFRIGAALRAQVRFEQLNLALPVFPSAATQTQALDIIFCRNVLMYFSRARMKKVIARFRACLVDGGWLVVNPSEASSELFEGFTPVFFPDAVFFRKNGAGAPAGRAALAAQPVAVAPPPPVAAASPRQARPASVRARRPIVVAPPAKASAAPPAHGETPARAYAETPAAGAYAETRAAGAHGETLARAHALVRAGDPGAALQCLRRAAEAGPLAAELHQASALIAIEQGEPALARQSLKRLLYLQPDSALAHYLSALVDDAQGRRASARALLERCHALLADAGAADVVPGADGWPAAGLRESVAAWLERAQ